MILKMSLLSLGALATIAAPTINVVQKEQMPNEANPLNINVTKKFLALTFMPQQVAHKTLGEPIFVANDNLQNLNFSITSGLLGISTLTGGQQFPTSETITGYQWRPEFILYSFEFNNVKLSNEEHLKLVNWIGEGNTKLMIEELSIGIESKGYIYNIYVYAVATLAAVDVTVSAYLPTLFT